ncbi:MAG TPA: hypothetical protein VKM72_34400 [Thermoanaerobaculia bacterium]|nr:hypothetical protein [Thermoanaerobaculia bacterium]
MAWDAAGLLPDGSDQKARYLATAGTWLKARDADAARPFYKAILECCSSTKLGKEAQQVRWFPEVPECEQEGRSDPPEAHPEPAGALTLREAPGAAWGIYLIPPLPPISHT